MNSLGVAARLRKIDSPKRLLPCVNRRWRSSLPRRGSSARSLVVECNSSKVVIRVRFPAGALEF